MSNEKFPPRIWIYADHIDDGFGEILLHKPEPLLDAHELISWEEHEHLLREETIRCIAIADKQIKEARTEAISKFEIMGTDGCRTCEHGRITMFRLSDQCLECEIKAEREGK